jgi:hypothetical protein
MGRFDEAEFEAQRAVVLDPLSAPIAVDAAWVSHYRGRQDEALGRIKAASAMDSSNSVLHFYNGTRVAVDG